MKQSEEVITIFKQVCSTCAYNKQIPDDNYINETFELYYEARLMELQTQN